ncbi:pirin family protein [Gordonia shandongensis]|uniref:pirin family protein n=1 Tax=Gordonia shandongensis TaxID=376351 RepID=UPI000416CE1E|nr:pirin family protein [Gordonia shandongensis]
MTPPAPTARLIPSSSRHFWANEWLTSRQSFPGTGNFDLFGNAHGVLAMHNDDVVAPGEGLDAHRHRNMEIVTWVVDGAVAHRDSHGTAETLAAGTVGAMTAGRGVTHSERNANTTHRGASVRVVQMWVPPHTDDLEPAHRSADLTDALATGDPVVAVSGRSDAPETALPIRNRYAALHIARPHPGRPVELPGAPFGHLYVVRGAVTVEVAGTDAASFDTSAPGGALSQGDALRLTDAGPVTVTAEGIDAAEILYWEMHASFDVPRSV